MNKQKIIIEIEGIGSIHSLNNQNEYLLCTRYYMWRIHPGIANMGRKET